MGLQYAEILLATVIGDPEQVLWYQNFLLGERHVLLGRIRLYQNKPEPAIRLFQKINAKLVLDTRYGTFAVQYHRYCNQIAPSAKKEQWKKALALTRQARAYAQINFEKDTAQTEWPDLLLLMEKIKPRNQ